MKCPICNVEEWIIAHAGPVRHGKNGSEDRIVYQCVGCEVQRINQFYDPRNYESGEYRRILEEPDWKYEEHDQKQLLLYNHLPSMRGKVVVDVGCGGGSFLDLIYGMAKDVIGIEPNSNYHDRPYRVYPYMKDAPKGIADVAVSFDVIEHVENPVEFLREMKELVKPGGDIYISTPNRGDVLLSLSTDYRAFWYRTVHNWYFDSMNLYLCGETAGLQYVGTDMAHRFGIENTLKWLSNVFTGFLDTEALDLQWKQWLKENQMSEFILIHFRRWGHE